MRKLKRRIVNITKPDIPKYKKKKKYIYLKKIEVEGDTFWYEKRKNEKQIYLGILCVKG